MSIRNKIESVGNAAAFSVPLLVKTVRKNQGKKAAAKPAPKKKDERQRQIEKWQRLKAKVMKAKAPEAKKIARTGGVPASQCRSKKVIENYISGQIASIKEGRKRIDYIEKTYSNAETANSWVSYEVLKKFTIQHDDTGKTFTLSPGTMIGIRKNVLNKNYSIVIPQISKALHFTVDEGFITEAEDECYISNEKRKSYHVETKRPAKKRKAKASLETASQFGPAKSALEKMKFKVEVTEGTLTATHASNPELKATMKIIDKGEGEDPVFVMKMDVPLFDGAPKKYSLVAKGKGKNSSQAFDAWYADALKSFADVKKLWAKEVNGQIGRQFYWLTGFFSKRMRSKASFDKMNIKLHKWLGKSLTFKSIRGRTYILSKGMVFGFARRDKKYYFVLDDSRKVAVEVDSATYRKIGAGYHEPVKKSIAM